MRLASGIMMAAAGLAIALPAPAAELVDQAAAKSSPKITVSGTIKVTGGFTVSKGLPAKTPVTAQLYMQTSDSIYNDNSSIQAQGTVVGGKLRFSATIPYTWLVAKRNDSVILTLNLTGVSEAAQGQFTYTTYLTKTIPLPKNGATTSVLFTGSL
jgi:hypothetical protein